MATINVATQAERVAVIASLIQKSPNIGATALMKCLYLSQEVFNIPLGYDYTIYTYGPYCSQVTSDIDISATDAFIAYDYELTGDYVKKSFRAGEKINCIDFSFANNYENLITQIANDFASKTASELELLTTIIYVHAFYKRNNLEILKENIINAVHGIKPHFHLERIKNEFDSLQEQNLLMNV